ncbi:MAG: hypothetical protein EOM67_13085, partial [Spirochaetia bacterium]|nr:hypothetical protein [Spirochaetia bacterium]
MSQRTISMQSLLRWIEKISANANTPQLDSIELNALSKHLNFLMDSKETSMSVVTVPSTGLVLSDNLSGVVVLNVPVTFVGGTGLVIPAITKAAEFGGKVTFLIKFVLDETVETFTVYNVLALFQEIQTSIFGTLLTLSKEEKDFLNYLDTITGQAWAEDDVLVFGVDFTTLLTLIDYIKADGLYEARTLNISVPELDLGSTVVNV